MTIASRSKKSSKEKSSDWRLFLKLVPYARRNARIIIVAICLLIPAALARAVQPIIIGQV